MPFKDFAAGEVLTASDVDTYLMSQVIIRCTSVTRPVSPALGWHIYETDTGRFLVYNGSAWVSEGIEQSSVLKPSDESVTSNTTFQDDDHLALAVSANTNYSLECFISMSGDSSGSAGGWRMGWVYPSGTTMVWTANAAAGSGTVGSIERRVWTESQTQLGATFGLSQPIAQLVTGTVRVGASAGTFRLRWAQSLTSATATSVLSGSWMRLTKF